ncbi:cytochrome c oxidase subunit II [Fluviicola taffensis]|uniref:cytochrome-c oxidase n=1 Tax=Fluviicola taffensis (strain DSM 16823 / NCIMB 13979 / RW262) TaxID=755732 RepID=F2IB87_FLUTR|nr:cytochrome c oxidase subunit II [Fluviicola taffensis]AEA43173.1 cytochrome c oxidase subunit II [Fluviicola taffensis DSM 16823]
MTKLIILIVIILGVIAIAQLVRMYELSSKLRNRREEDIPNRDNRMNATLLLVFMFAFFASVLYLFCEYGYTGRGEAATVHGAATDWLMDLNMWIIIGVFFITNGLLFGFAFKYVRKPGVKAYWFPHDNRLELAWTVVPAIVLAVIIILGLKSWNEQTAESPKQAIVVELFSKQFDWTVRMAGDDNTLGYFDYKLTNENNSLALMTTKTIQDAIDSMENSSTGIHALEAKLNNPKLMFIPEDHALMVKDLARKERMVRMLHQMKARHDSKLDARAMDDIVFNANDTLYLCKGKNYEFNFRSKDVIHSAYMPHFRSQMNTVPGQTTRFKFIPTITTKEMRGKMNNPKFNYILMCNKICGSSHYKMKLMVVVLDEPAYNKWYKKVSKLDPKAADLCKTFRNVYPVGKPKAVVADSTAVAAGMTVDTAAIATK